MRRFSEIRLALALLAALLPALMVAPMLAQDDPNDAPLGDVARSLRKKTPSTQQVIDDDNLSNVMRQAESRHAPGSALRFLMAGDSKGFQVSVPDATCSLSFNANAKSLLSSQYAQMDLPPGEMLKLEGPATIEGDALTVSVFNRTDWHVSEVAVALTVVKKNAPAAASSPNYGATPYGSFTSAGANSVPAIDPLPGSEVRPEKKPDLTVIYRMRAAAPPSTRTVFSAPLSLDLAPGDEWHWAIVQARGYPPQSYTGNISETAAQIGGQTLQPMQVVAPQTLPVPLPSQSQQ
jgi:hypothetical protein